MTPFSCLLGGHFCVELFMILAVTVPGRTIVVLNFAAWRGFHECEYRHGGLLPL